MTRKEPRKAEKGAADPSIRARLDGLLFAGTKLGTTLLTASGGVPKLPPGDGE
jgi:hypothetical protein